MSSVSTIYSLDDNDDSASYSASATALNRPTALARASPSPSLALGSPRGKRQKATSPVAEIVLTSRCAGSSASSFVEQTC